MKRGFLPAFIALLSIHAAAAGTEQGPPRQDWFPQAPPLPEPAGEIVRVTDVPGMFRAVEQAKPGLTILVEDGVYFMPRYLDIRADNVTFRSASGNPEDVVLDGSRSDHGELIGVSGCEGVTIAGVTVQNAMWNGVKINADRDVQRFTLYNCVIRNVWQRGVKSVRPRAENREEERPKDFAIRYCLFYNDRAKRYEDDPRDTPENFGGNYIGGIDAMYPKNWTIADNVFIGIQGRTREGRGCVFLWHHAEDCVIERNAIIDCDVGIALGNSSGIGEGESSIHGTRMIVRNNMIANTPETGILADYTRDCVIVHNTVHDPDNRLMRLIRLVHENGGLTVMNNILSGPAMRVETESPVRIENNLTGAMTRAFADPESGDLRLREPVSSVVDRGIPTPWVKGDFGGQARDSMPDLGADEWREPGNGGGEGAENKWNMHE